MRSADAFGATGVACLGASADPFGWKALRGSMGSALRLPVMRERDGLAAVRDAARRCGLAVVVAGARRAARRRTIRLDAPDAARRRQRGPWRAGGGRSPKRTGAVGMPMRDGVESLNVAVAAGRAAETGPRGSARRGPHDERSALRRRRRRRAPPRRRRAPPLADRMRPRTLDEFVGQQHLLAPGRPAARGDRARRPAVHPPVGPAGHRQDHARAPDRRDDERALHRVQRGAVRHQGDQGGDDGGRAGPPPARAPHDPLRRRDPPLQQGAAGRVPAPRRGRATSCSSARRPRTRRSR